VDPRLAYWTFALTVMGGVVACAVTGVRAVRHGDVTRHKRFMLSAVGLVGVFIASYLLKLATIGREHVATWGATSVWVLRIHELCVFTMILAGVIAGTRALRLRRMRNATKRPEDPIAPPGLVRWHRGAGRTAVTAAGLGFLFAMLILAGMYRRAGWL
jgi:uncharacterized membrane protein YozB (DUF420 family)